MKLKNLFNKLADLVASADFSNFSANDHLHQMALDDHRRAHNQAVSMHQRHVDMHHQMINTMHMMGPHF